MVDMKGIEKALRVHSLLILDNEGLPAMTIERDYLERVQQGEPDHEAFCHAVFAYLDLTETEEKQLMFRTSRWGVRMLDFSERIDLVCFDLDGTLVEVFGTAILPGVAYCFDNWGFTGKTAIVTNQGGVGLRYWMETNDFGDPAQYPTQRDTERRVEQVQEQLGIDFALISFAYLSSKGIWAPTPDDQITNERWSHDWRKPNPGMILKAIELAGTTPERTIMVGDREEDVKAAFAAGVLFYPRDVWFAQDY
jgi:HAD superfamily hydrolase (TIGR01662 family)